MASLLAVTLRVVVMMMTIIILIHPRRTRGWPIHHGRARRPRPMESNKIKQSESGGETFAIEF
jgi:hypothetical protein